MQQNIFGWISVNDVSCEQYPRTDLFPQDKFESETHLNRFDLGPVVGRGLRFFETVSLPRGVQEICWGAEEEI